jgi:hypothetical protein
MPDRTKDRNGGRPEFEIAYYTKELGQALQRKLLQKQLARFTDSGTISSSHGEDAEARDRAPQPPQDDRAG